jgi:hypothetical protein
MIEFIVAQVLGGPRDGEQIPLPDDRLPVEFIEHLSWTPPLDAPEGTEGPTRVVLIMPTYEQLPCENFHWVLRWPRYEDEGAFA